MLHAKYSNIQTYFTEAEMTFTGINIGGGTIETPEKVGYSMWVKRPDLVKQELNINGQIAIGICNKDVKYINQSKNYPYSGEYVANIYQVNCEQDLYNTFVEQPLRVLEEVLSGDISIQRIQIDNKGVYYIKSEKEQVFEFWISDDTLDIWKIVSDIAIDGVNLGKMEIVFKQIKLNVEIEDSEFSIPS